MANENDNTFELSHQLSRQQVEDAVSPFDVVALLNSDGIKYVLIGGHLLGHLTGSPRATVDVDVIVDSGQVARAVRALEARFPELTVQDLVHNVRFSSQRGGGLRAIDAERIDVVRADHPLFQRILERYSVTIQSKGHRILVPTVEAAVALKFAAAISPNRGADSTPQDRADLIAIIRKGSSLDETVLGELGELIYPGGGKELQQVAAGIRAGRNVSL